MSDHITLRNRTILDAAAELADQIGWHNLTRDAVAQRAGCATGTVNHAFGTIAALRDRVMEEAVARRIPKIVAEGLMAKHPAALAAPASLKADARRCLGA